MSQASTFLAIETATPIGSAALWHDGKLYNTPLEKPHQQAAQLLPIIESLLQNASITYADINGLAVTVGPGSFTGIRIGLSVARTIMLSFPTITPYSFTTLECLASQHTSGHVVAALNAGKGQIYHQSFTNGETCNPIQLSHPDELLDIPRDCIIGNTLDILPDALKPYITTPDLPSAEMMIEAILNDVTPPKRAMTPLYVRTPDAETSSKPLL